MEDAHYRYGASFDRENIPRSSFPGYLASEAPLFTSYTTAGVADLRTVSSDYLQKDIKPSHLEVYGFNDVMGMGAHPETVNGVVTAGTSTKVYSSALEGLNFASQRRDNPVGISPGPLGVPDTGNEVPGSLRNVDGISVAAGESNILFVDGLPKDCTRREVGHLFRPFIGYKEIKVVHKEPRRDGDEAWVLCFVEFIDAKCALTAMEALQGYKFDDKKLESPTLKIQFAHFPFRLVHDKN